MQKPTAKHYTDLGESCEKGGERIAEAREIKDATGKHTESTNLSIWGLMKTENLL